MSETQNISSAPIADAEPKKLELTQEQLKRLATGFAIYQSIALETDLNTKQPVVYPALGLASEAGEFAGKVVRCLNKSGELNNEDRVAMVLELGDILWYIAKAAKDLKVTLADIAAANIMKLQGRLERGTVHGEGDVR